MKEMQRKPDGMYRMKTTNSTHSRTDMSNPIDKAQQRIDELQQKLKQAKALKSRIEARQKVVESKKKRTEETRRKILAGALALEMMDRDEGVKARFMTRLDKYLTRTDDRALFGLPPVAQETPT